MMALLLRAAGPIADLALLVMLLELLVLTAYHRRTGRGIAPRDLLGSLAAGFFLVLALRFSLPGAGSGAIALSVLLCLTLSLAAHVYDLFRRWA